MQGIAKAEKAAMSSPLPQPLLDHATDIARLCQQHGVERLEVFGSAADGRFDLQRSDYDFIARFIPEVQDSIAQHFFELTVALEHLLGRRVDLMTDQPIHNPYFRLAVDATRREIYVRPAAQAPARRSAGGAPDAGLCRHDPDSVDNVIVFNAVTTSFAPLAAKLEQVLRELKSS